MDEKMLHHSSVPAQAAAEWLKTSSPPANLNLGIEQT